MKDDMSELKKRALAIVEVYSTLNRITDREADILHNAITTDRPQGEWIVHQHSKIMKCSLCGKEENAKDVGTIDPDKHFCSFCGAEMKGGAE